MIWHEIKKQMEKKEAHKPKHSQSNLHFRRCWEWEKVHAHFVICLRCTAYPLGRSLSSPEFHFGGQQTNQNTLKKSHHQLVRAINAMRKNALTRWIGVQIQMCYNPLCDGIYMPFSIVCMQSMEFFSHCSICTWKYAVPNWIMHSHWPKKADEQ